MQFDDIFDEIGEFGWYQGIILIIINFPAMLIGFLDISYIFVSAVPQYRCFVNGCDNDTTAYYEPFLNFTTPMNNANNEFSECQLYLQLNSSLEDDMICPVLTDNTQIYECNYWKYDNSVYKSTVVTQFDLVCDKSNLAALSQSMYMLGKMFGGISFGWIADKFGRKKVSLLTMFISFVTGVGSIYVPYYSLYTALKFILGVAIQGSVIAMLVMVVEVVGKKPRGHSGMINSVFYCFGELIAGGLAYGIRDWQWLQLACSAPAGIFLLFQFIAPESPRWLLLNGQIEGATKILKKIAKSNNRQFSEDILATVELDIHKDNNSNNGNFMHQASCLDLVRSTYLRYVTLISSFCFFMINVAFYVISMSAPSLGGNQYVNLTIISAVEIPAYLIGMFAMEKIGRRYTMCLFMIAGGIAGICTALIPTSSDFVWLIILMAAIGKFGAAGAYAIALIFFTEIFPTVARYNGLSVVFFVGFFGSVIAPYITQLEAMNTLLPLIAVGVCSFSSGLVGLILPETMGKPTFETVEDCETIKLVNCPRLS